MPPITDKKFKNVDEYISEFPPRINQLLKEIRSTIKKAAPKEAEEVISYNMPALKYHGIVVYYAAHKEHIGFYPGSAVVTEEFKDYLSGYETSKGTIKFPFEKGIPKSLVKKIVKYRVAANLQKQGIKTRANPNK